MAPAASASTYLPVGWPIVIQIASGDQLSGLGNDSTSGALNVTASVLLKDQQSLGNLILNLADSDPIAQTLHSFRFGAVVTAVKRAVFLHAMPHDLNTAMGTRWRKCMDGALEAVENVSLAAHNDLKGFVIVVAAMFTNGH